MNEVIELDASERGKPNVTIRVKRTVYVEVSQLQLEATYRLFPHSKIQAIKHLRDSTTLSLAESKDVIDAYWMFKNNKR